METNKRKHIFLVVGRTGSGKSTLVRNACETFGMKQLVSYTTRGMRKGEQDRTDHVFIRPGDVEKYAEEMVAYTEIGGAEYFSTASKLLESDFYTIDPAGVRSLYSKVSQTPALQEVAFHEIYVYMPEIERKARLYIRDGEVNEMRLQSEEVQFAHYEKERTFDYKIWNTGSLAYAQRQFDGFVERYLIEDRTAVSWSYELFHDQNHVIVRTDGYRSRVDALLAAQKYREERGWNDLTIRLFEVVKKAKGGNEMGGKRNRNHRRESTLQDLLHDDERLASYTVSSNPYVAYSCIVPKTIDLDFADIGSLMEESFHRLKECGADDNQLRFEMNAVPEEEVPEDDLIDGYVPLDLGYVIPGALLSFR